MTTTDPRDEQAHIPQQAGGEPTAPITTEQDAPAPRRRRWWIAGAVVAVLAAGGGTAYALIPTDEDEAVEHCQAAVRDKLYSPSTAVFAKDVEQNNTPPVYRVLGELDAQNKFGGTLRGEYICVLRHEDDGSWTTIDAKVINP